MRVQPPSNRIHHVRTLCAAALLAAAPALAGDPSAPAAEASTALLREARNAELDARRGTGDAEVAGLAAELAAHPGNPFGLQRRIAEAKENTELDLLTIQAKYARLAGNEEVALQLEALVEARAARNVAAAQTAAPAAAIPQKRGR